MNSVTTPVRQAIADLESAMKDQPQVDLFTHHDFKGGMCARTIVIPAGTLLTGAIHTQDQINIMYGDITIVTEEGEQRLTGYHVIPSPAGTKRVGYAHVDTAWTTVLKTDATTVEEVEALTAPTFEDPRLPDNQILELEA